MRAPIKHARPREGFVQHVVINWGGDRRCRVRTSFFCHQNGLAESMWKERLICRIAELEAACQLHLCCRAPMAGPYRIAAARAETLQLIERREIYISPCPV